MHKFVGLDRRRGGLSNLIVDSKSAVSQVRETYVPGLRALLSGPVLTNPADLLGSPRMDQIIDELGADCDYLLLDSPPIMAAADSTILASKVDGVIIVATMGETRTESFRDAVRQIQRAGTPILGYLVNKVRTQRLGYGSYRYRYHYYYYYRREEEEAEATGVGGNGDRPRSRGRSSKASRVRRRIGNLFNRNLGGNGSRSRDGSSGYKKEDSEVDTLDIKPAILKTGAKPDMATRIRRQVRNLLNWDPRLRG